MKKKKQWAKNEAGALANSIMKESKIGKKNWDNYGDYRENVATAKVEKNIDTKLKNITKYLKDLGFEKDQDDVWKEQDSELMVFVAKTVYEGKSKNIERILLIVTSNEKTIEKMRKKYEV